MFSSQLPRCDQLCVQHEKTTYSDVIYVSRVTAENTAESDLPVDGISFPPASEWTQSGNSFLPFTLNTRPRSPISGKLAGS